MTALRYTFLFILLTISQAAVAEPAAENRVRFDLPARVQAERLIPDSPFGVNTAFEPDTPDLDARLAAMRDAGTKWGRQDFTWRRIETEPGKYDWAGYDRLVEQCRKHGVLLIGDLAYGPTFHDPRTPEGVAAYARLAAAAAARYRGTVDHWQIWNEPNGGYWKGTPQQYAALLAAAGKAIHDASPDAKVLGLNMAFCDVPWATQVLGLVPYDCFDIACFHPYRPPGPPEDKFDWWVLDQYVKRWHRKDLTPEFPLAKMSFYEQADELAKAMNKFGKPKPLWVTEMCWNTHIHPYGVSELRQADLLVRFYVGCLAWGKVEKVFWWTLRDVGDRQFDQADMVGLMRADGSPKYGYAAYAWMTHMIEGKRWVRNDAWGPDVYVAVFTDDAKAEDTLVAWATRPVAYVRINDQRGLTLYDVYGTRRHVPHDRVRTASLPVPLGESPVYVVGPRGLGAKVRPDPGW